MKGLIQVLIVALVALVTAALILPLVAAVRDAAARMQCRNNLRQIGLSLHNYHDTNGRFPAATLPQANLHPVKRLSWLVGIVPYVEATNVYAKIDTSQGWEGELNRFLALTRWRIFHCPAYPEQPPTSTLEPTHYIGIAGLGSDAPGLPTGAPRAGFLGYDREGIKGHTGSLLVVLETGKASGAWTAGGPSTVRGLAPDSPPYLGGQFGGLHRRVCNALFADGSVRFLGGQTENRVLEAIATIDGSADFGKVGEEY